MIGLAVVWQNSCILLTKQAAYVFLSVYCIVIE